jgi:cell division protease FtsH
MAQERKPNDDRPPRPGNGPEGGPGGGGKGPTPPPTVKLSRGLMSWVMILSLLVMLFFLLKNTKGLGTEISTWQDFVQIIENKQIEEDSIIIKDDRVIAVHKQDSLGTKGEAGSIWVRIDAANREWFINELKVLNAGFRLDTGTSVWVNLLITLAPFLLLILLIWFFIARSMRSAGAGPGGMLGSFGKSRHRLTSKESVNVTFDDVAGVDEAEDEVQELVEFLKNPKKFQRLGGRIPRGVLLVGPPGCGKTLLAKAIAGEADVPFFSISGSDFVEMFVGVGASRVRDLFKQAKENSPCIIFLDEIDAVGRRRGGGFTTGGHDEREQTLNAILVEMDGFEANDQVIVIAATNRSDVLDPALTRPGRFDRQVVVPLPDLLGRKQILEIHGSTVKMGPDVDLERVARGTPMFSGADLAAIINEAAILATMANKAHVELADLEEAIPRGQAMGATFSLPEKDRYGFARRYLLDTLQVLCGGRIAEERRTNDISSGAAMDIQQATQFARHMILEWGMSKRLGFVGYAGADTRDVFIPEREYSDETARIVDEEVKGLIDKAYASAEKIIDEHWERVEAIAEALLKYETLQGEEVERIVRGERLDKPTVAELLEKEAAKTARPAKTQPAPAEGGEEPASGGDVLPSPA